ncbi:hypothetical protein [Tuwongella immobilis]|uniref:Uncharacterized protein n=1 Tax=Tuwongella immobilis TaxID=692036 RepID=A0A6C2YX78_9BACT|nr:hypothetical protein [Tuwongella immobilis]VIP05499.1 Uncharacterized protein OS=Blastopirellula marina DSM 3645 GN=DSM3645_07071 PE=4 SV=1 [Tuwongella immobilis]VTS08354.1 Uncharacterized protein OS=Blastopirellula marina DSM 3645 GN=DSM3645_07071 PE=4 SV=1 [Tuwongella immobilis]
MRRKGFWLTLGMLSFLAAGVVGILLVMLRREPAHYSLLEIEDSPVRKKNSVEFQTHFFDLMNSITNNDSHWSAEFTAEQMNSYFQEDFIRSNAFESMLPDGVHSPRIGINADCVRLAFRYNSSLGTTVVSLEMKCWLVANETNLLAVELLALRAGHLPLPTQTLLDTITEAAHQMNIDVKWYRHNGHPVGLMRFQADQLRPTEQLQRLHIENGKITIAGRSLLNGAIPPTRTPSATPATPASNSKPADTPATLPINPPAAPTTPGIPATPMKPAPAAPAPPTPMGPQAQLPGIPPGTASVILPVSASEAAPAPLTPPANLPGLIIPPAPPAVTGAPNP